MLKKILISSFVLLFCVYAYAENEELLVINDFSGGLDNHTNPFSLPKNKCQDALNVRFNDEYMALSKRDMLIAYGSANSAKINDVYRYYQSDGDKYLLASSGTTLYVGDDDAGTFTALQTELSDTKRGESVTYQDVYIRTNGYDQPLKWDGNESITANTDGHRTANNSCAELGSPFANLQTGTDLSISTWYKYKVAFYDGTNYYYSDAVSNSIKTGTTVHTIELTDIPKGPSGTTNRYVYRTDGYSTESDVENATDVYLTYILADNTTTTIDDITGQGVLLTDQAPTWTTVSAGIATTPKKGKYATIQDERLFISGNTTYKSDIYWSEQYKPDIFIADDTNYEQIRPDDGDEITSISTLQNSIAISKKTTWQKLFTDGDPYDDWYVSPILSYVGCPAPYTARNTPLGIMYLSRYGLYLFNGRYSEPISDAVTKTMRDINQAYAEEAFGYYWDNKFMLAFTSESTGSANNDRLLVYNLIRDSYTLDSKNINCMTTLESGSDFGVLYYGSSTSDGYIFTEGNTETILEIKYKSDLDEGTYDDCRAFGEETAPYVKLAWDLTWGADWQTLGYDTMGNMTTSTFALEDLDGSWTSKVYRINANELEILYWNEDLGGYGDVELKIRTGASEAACLVASWSELFTTPSGSDISAETANDYIQIAANLSTSDIKYTPLLEYDNGYVIRATYNREGQDYETSINSLWQSGWQDLFPGYFENILHIKVFYVGSNGTLTLGYKNIDGSVNGSFDIDISQEPSSGDVEDITDSDGDIYIGADGEKVFVSYMEDLPVGRSWFYTITDNGIYDWTVKRIEVLCKRESLEHY